MSKKEKLLKRLLSRPKDFTFDELCTLLLAIGFHEKTLGKTSGSRVAFVKNEMVIRLHKPHPRPILKPYQIETVIEQLKEVGEL